MKYIRILFQDKKLKGKVNHYSTGFLCKLKGIAIYLLTGLPSKMHKLCRAVAFGLNGLRQQFCNGSNKTHVIKCIV